MHTSKSKAMETNTGDLVTHGPPRYLVQDNGTQDMFRDYESEDDLMIVTGTEEQNEEMHRRIHLFDDELNRRNRTAEDRATECLIQIHMLLITVIQVLSWSYTALMNVIDGYFGDDRQYLYTRFFCVALLNIMSVLVLVPIFMAVDGMILLLVLSYSIP